ncbi:AMP-binding protein [Pseudonocardia sp. KRD-184]|uniref:AMP-binding protein n=1 Tax=Pseudonocardia oceani TaxID=2792013 RepID=A0ABS6UB87_9PSEU|nr:AMP-binding protein [Pseudonocardia oceani]MBW0091662.1 AMP-binding protein [Pseudonocardia oceani]MBW0094583.1 AMP-binding protein [Pseudonocardia oceani]MBW0107973.1 AMP-binding protein [Pseudonocardia oceani]MBW0119927.1 AMP-binding protein [Pseudonocardia oceani]MBW0129490.1 AMP-binding protein [Pseudonocardia oceani]
MSAPETATDLPPFDPDRAAAYLRDGLWGSRTVGDRLRDSAERFAGRLALVTAEQQLSYRELDDMTDAFAAGVLATTALRPGDRVMFSAGNVAETVVAYYGCVKAGLLPVCTLPAHGHREIGLLAEHTGARGHVVQADFGRQDLAALSATVGLDVVISLRGHLPGGVGYDEILAAGASAPARAALAAVEIDPDGLVAFQLSGGTTGLPKVAPRRHREYVHNAEAFTGPLGIGPDSVVLHVLPIMHNAGIAAAMQPAHWAGAAFVLGASADAAAVFEIVHRERVTTIPLLPPAVVIRLLERAAVTGEDLRPVERMLVGGQKLPAEAAARIEPVLGVPCAQMFGMAEGMFLATPPDAPAWVRERTVGSPVSAGDEIRVLEIGGELEVPDGELGELACRGPYTVPGYYRAAAHNAATFTGDGFYRTGDLAVRHVVDGRTYYAIEGRIKDVINRGAEKIHAEEVEEIVVRHPDVTTAALVAMPDPVLGERACVFLILAAGAPPLDVAGLGEFLRGEGLARYKWPERVEVVAELPLTNVGKVSKKDLRDRLAEAVSA